MEEFCVVHLLIGLLQLTFKNLSLPSHFLFLNNVFTMRTFISNCCSQNRTKKILTQATQQRFLLPPLHLRQWLYAHRLVKGNIQGCNSVLGKKNNRGRESFCLLFPSGGSDPLDSIHCERFCNDYVHCRPQ